MMIVWLLTLLILAALAVAFGLWLRRRKRLAKRLAAAYDRVPTAARAKLNDLLSRPRPPYPIPPAPIRPRPREPETDALEWPRPTPTPTFSPDLFSIPSPLDPSPSPSDWSAPSPIEPGGGEFGGAGASGSWDDSPKGGD
jgi:hypothetical protein